MPFYINLTFGLNTDVSISSLKSEEEKKLQSE
jgi:hypothetical protein